MKEKINEHDMTKNMIDIIRGGYKTKLIKEADEQAQEQEPNNEDVETTYVKIDSDNSYWKTELKKIQDVLSNSSIRFTEISYSVPLSDVILRGQILSTRQGSNDGITFVFSLLGGENTNNIKNKIDTAGVDSSDEDIKNLVKSLGGYYDNWVQDAYVFLTEMSEKEKQ